MNSTMLALSTVLTTCIVTVGCGNDEGGGGGRVSVTPGLWVGQMESQTPPEGRWEICLFVNDEGDRLLAAEACNLDAGNPGPFSVQLRVLNAGISSGDQACSFDFETAVDVPIDPDGGFAAAEVNPDENISISGSFGADFASGTASAQDRPNVERCDLMEWTARPAAQ